MLSIILLTFFLDYVVMLLWQTWLKQGFWYFARSRTCEIQVFPRNTAKSAKNISKYIQQNIFNTYLGY